MSYTMKKALLAAALAGLTTLLMTNLEESSDANKS